MATSATDSRKNPSEGLRDSLIPEEDKKQQVKISEVKSLKDLWIWFIKDPLSRWPLVFFLITFVLVLLWLIIYLASGNGGYVIAGVAGCITALFGWHQFRLLMALKEQVEVTAKLNSQFKNENMAVLKEVNSLQNATSQLTTTEGTLRQSTEKQKANLHNLNQLNENLSQMGGANNDAFKKIHEMSKSVVSKWKDQLQIHERDMLISVYEQHEMKDNQSGLQEDEYNQFLAALPTKYQERLKKLGTFKQLAGNDNVLDYEEFKGYLDKMAAQEVEQ